MFVTESEVSEALRSKVSCVSGEKRKKILIGYGSVYCSSISTVVNLSFEPSDN
jgi:hypothetical protein